MILTATIFVMVHIGDSLTVARANVEKGLPLPMFQELSHDLVAMSGYLSVRDTLLIWQEFIPRLVSFCL